MGRSHHGVGCFRTFGDQHRHPGRDAAGYLNAGWSSRRVRNTERKLARYLPLSIDDPHLNEWARLSTAARGSGVALSDNDLWIAATAAVRRQTLVTCDRDHVRLAPDMPVEVVFFAPPI
jgi:predicted nucleic acid-binding protein